MKNAFTFQMVKMQYCTPPPSPLPILNMILFLYAHKNIHKNQRFVISEVSLNCSYIHNKKSLKNPLTFILQNDIYPIFS